MKSNTPHSRQPAPAPIPAFPTIHIPPDHVSGLSAEPGMCLRDYFATRALVVAFAHLPESKGSGWDSLANTAYAIADSMLAARERK